MSEDETWRTQATMELCGDFNIVRPEFLDRYVSHFGVTRQEAAQILTERDRKFASGSDYVLANFEGSIVRSMGTCIELGWADNGRTTTVAVLPEDNCHVHPIVKNVCQYVVEELDEALAILSALAWRN